MSNPNSTQNRKTLNACLFAATLAVFAFVCLAALIMLAGETEPQASERSSISYAELNAKKKSLTETQWKEFEAGMKGKRVRWTGHIANVADDILGDNYVWVDMHGAPDGDRDVYFAYPLDASLSLNRNQAITFEGDYAGLLLGVIHLENGAILP